MDGSQAIKYSFGIRARRITQCRHENPRPSGCRHGATHARSATLRCHPVSTHTFDCSRLSLVRQNSQSAVRVFLPWRGTLPAMAYLPDLPLHEPHRCDTCATERCLRSQAGGFHLSSYWPTFSVPAQVRSFAVGSSHRPLQRISAATGYQEAEIPKRLPYLNQLSSPLAYCVKQHTHLSAYSPFLVFVTFPRTPRGCLVLP